MSSHWPPSPAERKATKVLAVLCAEEVVPLASIEGLAADFGRYIVGAIIDPERGVDRIEHRVDEDFHFFFGYHGRVTRLLVGLIIDDRAKTAEVTLRATKGARDALHDTAWGDHGANVGNSILVARTLHVGLVALRRAGIHVITNQPYDDRVRAHYTAMGFVGGERLDLTSASSLARAFDFIAKIYGDHNLELDDPPP